MVDVFRFGDGHYVSIDDSRNVVLNLPEGTQSLTLDQILNVWLFRDGNGASKVEIRFREKGWLAVFPASRSTSLIMKRRNCTAGFKKNEATRKE